MSEAASGYDAFLSYTRLDAVAAETLRARLAEAGLRSFLDRYALPAGQAWQPRLEAALAGCRALIVLLGPSGLGGWQHREIQLGLDRQAASDKAVPFPVIPVLLPNLQKDDIPLGRFLGLNTWIDLRQGLDEPEGLQRLIRGVQGQALDTAATSELLAGLSPYRGLLPFREQDAGLFFGRTRFVDELVTKVRQRTSTNTVAVVGRSGSGKSSVAYAGLFPALRREKGVGQQAVWDIISLRPLAEPLHQLARAFAPSPGDVSAIATRAALNKDVECLRKGEVTVSELVRDRLQTDKGSTRVLLYVDQWEELYTQARPREIRTEEDQRATTDARMFIDLLLEAAVSAACTLVLSVRSDFYPEIQNHDALRAAVQDSQLSLGPMNERELRAAIEGPAKAVGARVHPDLTSRLIRDIGLDVTAGQRDHYDIGKLPLLEYALEQTWTKRTGPEIGLAQYAGLEQALEERANQLYESLSATQQATAKRLFVSLVTPGEGREDTRARITLPPDPTTLEVVEAFAGTDARLIVTGDATGGRSAEVTHEALIRHWDKLRTWVDENRENLRIRDSLTGRRAEWVRHNKHHTLLIERGLPLEAARKLYAQPGDVVIDDVKDYIDASFDQDDRRRFWRRLGIATVAAVAMVMTALAWFAWDQWDKAEAAKKQANENAIAAERQREQALRSEGAALGWGSSYLAILGKADSAFQFASRGLPRLPSSRERPLTDAALLALFRAQAPEPVAVHMPHGAYEITDVRLTLDEKYIATSSWDGSARVLDANSLNELSVKPWPPRSADSWSCGIVTSVDVSADSTLLAAANLDGRIRIWKLLDEDPMHEISASSNDARCTNETWGDPRPTILSIRFDRSGRLLVSAAADGSVSLWDTASGILEDRYHHTTRVNAAVFDRTREKVIVLVDDEGLLVRYDFASKTRLGEFQLNGTSLSITLDEAGELALVTLSDSTARLIHLVRGEEIKRFTGHVNWVTKGAFGPSGRWIATGSDDGTVRLSDPVTGATFGVHSTGQQITAVAVARKTGAVIISDRSGKLHIWKDGTGLRMLDPGKAVSAARARFKNSPWAIQNAVSNSDLAANGSIEENTSPSAFALLCDFADDPDDPQRSGRGIEIYRLNHLTAAPACEQAVRNYRNVGRYHYNLGRILFRKGETTLAEQKFREAVEAGSGIAAVALAGMLRRKGAEGEKQSLNLMKAASEKKVGIASWLLAGMSWRGGNSSRDTNRTESIELALKAAKEGYPAAHVWLAENMDSEDNELRKAQAMFHYAIAAETYESRSDFFRSKLHHENRAKWARQLPLAIAANWFEKSLLWRPYDELPVETVAFAKQANLSEPYEKRGIMIFAEPQIEARRVDACLKSSIAKRLFEKPGNTECSTQAREEIATHFCRTHGYNRGNGTAALGPAQPAVKLLLEPGQELDLKLTWAQEDRGGYMFSEITCHRD
jgi:hypothetical protein